MSCPFCNQEVIEKQCLRAAHFLRESLGLKIVAGINHFQIRPDHTRYQHALCFDQDRQLYIDLTLDQFDFTKYGFLDESAKKEPTKEMMKFLIEIPKIAIFQRKVPFFSAKSRLTAKANKIEVDRETQMILHQLDSDRFSLPGNYAAYM